MLPQYKVNVEDINFLDFIYSREIIVKLNKNSFNIRIEVYANVHH